MRNTLLAAALALVCTLPMATPKENTDPYVWLEDVQGERALAWVRERNAVTLKELQSRSDYAPTRERLLQVLNDKQRIPHVARRGEWLYNFWQDAEHQRGLWRRTSLAEYRKRSPAWEVILDLDTLGKAEKVDVEVILPHGKGTLTQKSVAANQVLKVKQ